MNRSNEIVSLMWSEEGFLQALEDWDLPKLKEMAEEVAFDLSARGGYPVMIDDQTWSDIRAYLNEDRKAI